MKHLRFLLMAALVALPLTACDEDDDGDVTETPVTGTITGTVTAEGDGLANVSVTLSGGTTLSATTNASGVYTFENVESGSYGVSIDASTHADVTFPQTAKSTSITTQGQTATVDFSGNYIRTASISGTVTASGDPVAGLDVSVSGGPDNVTKSAVTDLGGGFSVSGLRGGDYTVTISDYGAEYNFAQDSKTVSVGTGMSATATFAGTLLEDAMIMGFVLADGSGVGGVTVTLSGGASATATTNGAGQFEFDELDPGTYTVTISGYDTDTYTFPTTSETVTVDYGDVEEIVFSGNGKTASVAIEQITTNAGVAVDRQNVAGMVIVQVGVDEGTENITKVYVELNGIQFGEQTFGSTVAAQKQSDDEEFEIDFVLNTAKTLGSAPYTPIWFNGQNTMTAYAVSSDGDVVTATENIVLVNADRLALNIANSNPGGPDFIIDANTGLRWLSGSLTFTLYPIIYSSPFDPNDPPIARANLMFESFVSTETAGSDGVNRPWPGQAVTNATVTTWAQQDVTPGADGEFVFTFSDANAAPAGVRDMITGFIGVQDFGVQTITKFGQNGPGAFCANTTTSCVGTGGTTTVNPLVVYFQQELQSGTGAVNNILRVDNQDPWVNTIALTAHTLWSKHAASIAANYPALIDANGVDMVRGGMNLGDGYGSPSLRDGWVNHDYAFNVNMWNSAGATDSPNTWPPASGSGFSAYDPLVTPGASYPPLPGGGAITGGVTPLSGIGLAPTSNADRLGFYAVASNTANQPSALAVTGMAGKRQRLVSATGATVSTGADLPGENCLGCDVLPAPNTDSWDDVSVAAIGIDMFYNAGVSNVLEVGVDGKAPVYIGAITDPIDDATVGGSKYNTYGRFDSRGVLKADGNGAGQFSGQSTDGNNGYSGVAGIDLRDYENGCVNAGELQCFSGTMNLRNGFQMQPNPGAPVNTTLTWNWQLIGSTFFDTNAPYVTLPAYASVLNAPAGHDGYRQQEVRTYDRADNATTPSLDDNSMVAEHINDKTNNDVGNVTMDPTALYTRGQSYVWGGQTTDGVDLDFSDFGFDFNGITTIQTYVDPMPAGTNIPQADVDGRPYVGTSLQLPLRVVDHTDWGAASIYLQADLSENVDFLGCLARFDEGGFNNARHRPRGPRWRTWDQAFDNWGTYGGYYQRVNWQFNTFVFTSVPACPNTVTTMVNRVDPAFGTAGRWGFGIDAFSGTVPGMTPSGQLEFGVNGPSGTFTPTVDVGLIDLYYIDISGRARLVDPAEGSWTGPVVFDTGSGPTARNFVWEWNWADGTPPTDIITTVAAAPAGTSDGYFFVYRFGYTGTLRGEGMIWDNSLN